MIICYDYMYNKERNAQSNCDLWRIVNCQHCVIEMLWSFSIAMYLIFNYVTTIHINICVLVPSETQCNHQGGFHD